MWKKTSLILDTRDVEIHCLPLEDALAVKRLAFEGWKTKLSLVLQNVYLKKQRNLEAEIKRVSSRTKSTSG